MAVLGDEAQVELDLVHLEMVLILTQDRCKVYAERTIAWKSFWRHPIETPR